MDPHAIPLAIDDARRLVWHLMLDGPDPDPLWVLSASRYELTAWLGNYAAPLPYPDPNEGGDA